MRITFVDFLGLIFNGIVGIFVSEEFAKKLYYTKPSLDTFKH